MKYEEQIPVGEGDDYSLFASVSPDGCPHSVSLVFEMSSVKGFSFLKASPGEDHGVFSLELSPEILDDLTAEWTKYRLGVR